MTCSSNSVSDAGSSFFHFCSFICEADKAATLTVESGSPAATLVDFFPMMKYIPTWLPFAAFKRKALETREAVEAMFHVPYELVKKDMVSACA